MKFRRDFVTNSSSSSFVISFKESPEFTNILKAIFKVNEQEVKIIKTEEELLKELDIEVTTTIEDALETCSSWREDIYRNSSEKIKNGFSVATLNIDWDDEGIAKMLQELEKIDENFTIIDVD